MKNDTLPWMKTHPEQELLNPELRTLTPAEFGAHLRLRFQYWIGGCKPLPDDDRTLALIVGCSIAEWEAIRGVVIRLWKRRHNTIFHPRTRLEWNNSKSLHDLRAKAAKIRHGKSPDIKDIQGFADDVEMQKGVRNETNETNGTDDTKRTRRNATNETNGTNGTDAPGASADSGIRGAVKAGVRPIRPIRPNDDGWRRDDIAGRLADLVAAVRQVGVTITDADAGMVERFAKAATEGPASIDGWYVERIAARKDSFVESLRKARNAWGLMITDFERFMSGMPAAEGSMRR